jgi:hypothetical protein
MVAINRAKLFSPFAALRGYEEEITDQQREHELISKTELSDEASNMLTNKLLQIRKGTIVTLRYFKPDDVCAPLGHYETLTGTVVRIDPVYREIEIKEDSTGMNTSDSFEKSISVRIPFDDLDDLIEG